MEERIKKLEKENQNLQKKLNKYQHSYFGPIYIVSLAIIYFVCQIFNVDQAYPFFKSISNSFVFTIAGGIITGSILGTCKLEYMSSVHKIKRLLSNNRKKIGLLKQSSDYSKTNDKNNLFGAYDNEQKQENTSELKQSVLRKIDESKINHELEKIRLNIIKESVLEIMRENNIQQEYQEEQFLDIQLIHSINIEEIKEKVHQKRLGI